MTIKSGVRAVISAQVLTFLFMVESQLIFDLEERCAIFAISVVCEILLIIGFYHYHKTAWFRHKIE